MIKIRLLKLLSRERKYIIFEVIWQWISLIAQIAIIYCVSSLFQLLYERSLTAGQIITYIVYMAAGIGIRAVCDHQAVMAGYHASVNVKRVLRDRIYQKLLRLGASYRESVSSSSIIQMSGEGVEQLETYFGKYLSQFFYALLAPLTLFAVLSRIDLMASLILLLAVPLIPIVIMVVMIVARKLLDKYFTIYYGLGDSFLDNLQGLTTHKVYQSDTQAAEKMDAESENFRKITMKVLSMQLNSTAVMDIVAYGGSATGMAAALLEFMGGRVNLFGALMIILLSAEYFLPMRLLGSYFHIGMNGMKASDKIFAFLDLDEPEDGNRTIGQNEVDIQLKHVHFSYEEGKPVLNDVSFELKPHSFVSIVGVSGSGKSTIASLIMKRNIDYDGSITVNGIPLSEISEESIMRHVTMVSHHAYIFKGTIRENLQMGDPAASEKQMEDILKKVHLREWAESQNGLDTLIEDNGSNLSGGQRQRLALARALLHDTPVYVFDEATSSIDAESEEQIMEVIHGLAETRTILLISHRLHNVVDSDDILMLDKGRIVEEGTHAELMRNNGAYADLYNAQKELEEYGKEKA